MVPVLRIAGLSSRSGGICLGDITFNSLFLHHTISNMDDSLLKPLLNDPTEPLEGPSIYNISPTQAISYHVRCGESRDGSSRNKTSSYSLLEEAYGQRQVHYAPTAEVSLDASRPFEQAMGSQAEKQVIGSKAGKQDMGFEAGKQATDVSQVHDDGRRTHATQELCKCLTSSVRGGCPHNRIVLKNSQLYGSRPKRSYTGYFSASASLKASNSDIDHSPWAPQMSFKALHASVMGGVDEFGTPYTDVRRFGSSRERQIFR